MEKKKMRNIEASAAIFMIVAVTFILGTGPSIVADPYPGGPFHDRANVLLSATDDISGVAYINYSITCSNPAYTPLGWQSQVGSAVGIVLTIYGTYTIQYFAVDNYGNTEAIQETTFDIIPLDETPPTTTISINDTPPT
jgi:hypothetical protein